MSEAWTGALPYFPEHELRCKGTGVILLHPTFAATLPALRVEWGKPLVMTSVCRSPEHNKAVSGHPRSLHLTENPDHPTLGTAAGDISWLLWNREKRLEFAQLAWCLGWSVGLHDTFVHVDRRLDIGLEQRVFTYGNNWSGFAPADVTESV